MQMPGIASSPGTVLAFLRPEVSHLSHVHDKSSDSRPDACRHRFTPSRKDIANSSLPPFLFLSFMQTINRKVATFFFYGFAAPALPSVDLSVVFLRLV